MADDRLKNFVLALADTDCTLSEQARLVVLAALEGSNDLAEVLGDDATSSELVESLTAVEEESAEPDGAYLRSITVQRFCGIGAEVTLPFHPGPGLTVVAGRNGSGKSTLADGLELALTGTKAYSQRSIRRGSRCHRSRRALMVCSCGPMMPKVSIRQHGRKWREQSSAQAPRRGRVVEEARLRDDREPLTN